MITCSSSMVLIGPEESDMDPKLSFHRCINDGLDVLG